MRCTVFIHVYNTSMFICLRACSRCDMQANAVFAALTIWLQTWGGTQPRAAATVWRGRRDGGNAQKNCGGLVVWGCVKVHARRCNKTDRNFSGMGSHFGTQPRHFVYVQANQVFFYGLLPCWKFPRLPSRWRVSKRTLQQQFLFGFAVQLGVWFVCIHWPAPPGCVVASLGFTMTFVFLFWDLVDKNMRRYLTLQVKDLVKLGL